MRQMICMHEAAANYDIEYKAANVLHYSEQHLFGEVTTCDTNELARCMRPY